MFSTCAQAQHNNNTLGSQNSNPNMILADTDGEVPDSLPPHLDFEVGSGGSSILDIQESLTKLQTLRNDMITETQSSVTNGLSSRMLNKKKTFSPVSNTTLNSSNKGRVIIIQVTDPLANTLMSNPIKINKLITKDDSPFRKYEACRH